MGIARTLAVWAAPAVLAGCNWAHALPDWDDRRWLKAALHTHTVHSDGEATPEAMLRWYKKNGFDVVALTDHNRNTPLGPLFGNVDGPLIIPGIEYTSRGAGRPVHVNGLFSMQDIEGLEAPEPLEALTKMLDHFRVSGAMAIVNHPNYEDGLTLTDLEGADFTLLEVYNASSGTRSDGDERAPSVERMWDALLHRGRRVYGVATDDAHALPGGRNGNVPGKAWVMIYARPDLFDVRSALETGRFYASTGPDLQAYRVSASGQYARVRPRAGVSYSWTVHGGEVPTVHTGPAIWVARPERGYRRARLDASDGSRIYLQPVFADGP